MTDTFVRLKASLADRYAIQEELGAGGMATVYLARDLKHDREVAVKVLRPELAAVVGAERFLHEIQIAAKLNHPHILTLIDSGEADGFLYYVMPYVQGESLRDKLHREKQLSVEEALAITQGVASAMAYAHAHLRRLGVVAVMRDCVLHLDEYSNFFKVAQRFDYVVMETAIASRVNDHYVAKEVAKHSSVILVGPYATAVAPRMIKRPEVYAVLRGEYEKSLAACLESGKGGVYEFDEWRDVDDAPFPTRDKSIYAYKMARHSNALNMWGSRGCPFHCTFCYSQRFQCTHKYRGHGPERIRQEIMDVLVRFPKLTYIYFDDDTFNIGNKRVCEIAKVMKGIGLPWGAMCRADTTGLDTFRAMKDGGCVEVKIGIESGSQRVLDEVVKKGLDLDVVKKVVPALRKMGLQVHGTFMRGFKGETPEEARMTRRLITELQCSSYQLSDLRKQ